MEKTFNYSFNIVFKRCKDALNELDMNIDNSSLNERYISASTNGSILSWGEEIDIKFEKISLNRTKILVQSQASAQLFSWGKNSGNERAIIETLDEKLKNR